MEDLLKFLQIVTTVAPLIVLVIVIVRWSHKRANEILHHWANNEGYTLISAENRYWRTGPYFLNHYRGQMIFRIVVRDSEGRERSGWVRIGSWFAGVFSEKTHVTWDTSK
jgi:hypothetical protein